MAAMLKPVFPIEIHWVYHGGSISASLLFRVYFGPAKCVWCKIFVGIGTVEGVVPLPLQSTLVPVSGTSVLDLQGQNRSIYLYSRAFCSILFCNHSFTLFLHSKIRPIFS